MPTLQAITLQRSKEDTHSKADTPNKEDTHSKVAIQLKGTLNNNNIILNSPLQTTIKTPGVAITITDRQGMEVEVWVQEQQVCSVQAVVS